MEDPTRNEEYNQDGEELEVPVGFKVHISRVPTKFNEEIVERILKENLAKQKKDDDGEEDKISVELIYPRDDEEEETEGKWVKEKENGDEDHHAEEGKEKKPEHRGFGFVTFSSESAQQLALKLQTIRGGRKVTSTKKHTMYIRPYAEKGTENEEDSKNICYLWMQHRCPYGDECKFTHSGPGGCRERPQKSEQDDQQLAKKKRGRCFAFKKGKCTKGDDCPFSHDFEVTIISDKSDNNSKEKKEIPNSEKDCINWKTKGKCRKGNDCPYRHDPEKQKAALLKLQKKKKKNQSDETAGVKKQKQPLSIRVFGMNYETSEQDIRDFFQDCGKVQDVSFPTFEDSGRSKGYCGVWFSSPKAVAKAVELDGQELQGRWLQIQAGKMYLKQWEQNHPPSKRQRIE